MNCEPELNHIKLQHDLVDERGKAAGGEEGDCRCEVKRPVTPSGRQLAPNMADPH